MAENVQYRLEETLTELELMQKLDLFNANEIRKVTKRRREFQYKLQRRTKTKEDFLNYIQFETNLLKLVGKRRKHLKLNEKKSDLDYSIATRINRLYKTTVYRYQSDVNLWLSHIKFLESINWKECISRIYSRMLQVHSDKPKIWIYAANWEIMQNSAAESARNLMLNALRFHPNSKELYLECFHIELIYADRIRKRGKLFGLDKEVESTPDAVTQGKVAYAIFKDAMEKINDVDFHLSFLPIAKKFDFTEELEDEMFRDIQDRHATEESMWSYLAKIHLIKTAQQLNNVSKEANITQDAALIKGYTDCFEIYKTAAEIIPTEKMWSLYIETCLEGFRKSGSSVVVTEAVRDMCKQEAMAVMRLASSRSLLAQNLYLEWTSLLKEDEELDDMDSVLLDATEQFHGSVALWKIRIENMIKNGVVPPGVIQKSFNEAVNAVDEAESLPIWLLALKWTRISSPEKLGLFFERALKADIEIAVPLKPVYLEYVALNGGVEDARNLYQRIRFQSPICKEFFYKMLKIEDSQLSPNIIKQRNIMEDLVNHFGQSDIKPWLDYINLEKNHPNGRPMNVSKIHWRAIKTLEPELEARFTTAFALINAKSLDSR